MAEPAGLAGRAAPRVHKLLEESFNPRMLGFLLSRAWVCLLFFSVGILGPGATQETLDLLNNLSRSVLIGVLLLGAFLLPLLLRRLSVRTLALIAGAIAVAGTLLLPLASWEGIGPAILLGAAALTGVGSALGLLLWGIVYGNVSGPVVAAEASLAYALSSLVAPLCFGLPDWGQAAVGAALMAGSTGLLLRCESPVEGNGEKPSTSLLGMRPTRQRLGKIAGSCVLFGVVLSVLRYFYEHSSSGVPLQDHVMVQVVPAFAAGAIVLAVLLFSRRLDLAFSYRPVLWLLALGCFLLPMFDHQGYLPYFFARAGYVTFTIITWVVLADLSCKGSLTAARIFGLGEAALSSGLMVGALLGRASQWFEFSLSDYLMPLSGGLIFLLILVYTLVFTERDASRLIGRRDPAPLHCAALDTEPEEAAEGAGPGGSNPLQVAPRMNLEERCEALAFRHHMGERATQVLCLYARGRTRARIEEELYISRGTVNFHLRNIYQTLGVHSRQELLDVLDDPALEEDFSRDQ